MSGSFKSSHATQKNTEKNTGTNEVTSNTNQMIYNNTTATASRVLSGAMALFGSPGSETLPNNNAAKLTNPKVNTSPQDIPKEELLHLCMKMNKRISSLETRSNELLKKNQNLFLEKEELYRMLCTCLHMDASSLLLNNNNNDNKTNELAIDMNMLASVVESFVMKTNKENSTVEQQLFIQKASHKAQCLVMELQHKQQLKEMQIRFENKNNKNDAESKSTIESANCEDIITEDMNEIIQKYAELQCKYEQLEFAMNALKEKSKDTDSSDSSDGQSSAQQDPLMVGNDVNTSDAMEGVSGRVGSYDALPSAGTDVTNRQLESVQKQLHLHSQQLSTCTMLLEEREYAITSLNEMIDSLKKRNTELTLEVDKLKTKVRESDKSIAAGAVMKQEMESLLQHCRKDIVRCKQEKQELERKLKQMEGDMLSKSNEYNQASGVYERLKELELQCNEKTALITRLRAESSANEKNYALKTTLMVNTDIQLTECKELNSQLKSEVKALTGETLQLKQQLATEKDNKINHEVAMAAQVMSHQKEIAAIEFEKNKQIEELSLKSKVELEKYQQELLKRSQVARLLIEEKEEEIKKLKDKNHELQVEVSSGAPGERKIFALAELQAKRDLAQGLHKESQDLALQQLQIVLESKDFELAALQQKHTALVSECIDLRRMTKREGVSMDYLKNIIFKYMTYPIQSPERQSLIPVISTILAFSEEECKLVSTNSNIWNAVRTPIQINR